MVRSRVGVACLLAIAAVGTAAQEPPPNVGAVFVLESTAFRDGLGEEVAAALEERVSRHLATGLDRHFAFLSWVTAADAGEMPATRVMFKMVDRELPDACSPESRLILRVVLNDGEDVVLEGVPDVPLFTTCDADYPNHEEDFADLATRLETEITALLANEEFRKSRLQEKFLKKISLIGKVILRSADERIVLPLRCADLLPDRSDSRVRVEFNVHGVNNTGEITMSLPAQSDELVTCEIEEFNFSPVLDFASPTSWDEMITSVLDEANLTTLSVFMESYERDDLACPDLSEP